MSDEDRLEYLSQQNAVMRCEITRLRADLAAAQTAINAIVESTLSYRDDIDSAVVRLSVLRAAMKVCYEEEPE